MHFSTFECRASLTRRKGKSTIERFVQHAELYGLPRSRSFQLGERTLIPATETRGAFATIPVDVEEQLGFRFPSGYERTGAAAGAAGGSAGGDDESGASDVQTSRYVFTLMQERRPPLAGCWLLRDLLPVRDYVVFDSV